MLTLRDFAIITAAAFIGAGGGLLLYYLKVCAGLLCG